MTLDIFVPFWGDPEMLRQTVRSVLEQQDPDWVLTVVDDAYPDPGVEDYFRGFDDPRVRYVRNETNLGITENYRTCVRMAEHDLVVLLGCDDLMLPGYVGVVRAAHRAFRDVDIIQPGVQVVDERGRVVAPLVDRVKRQVTPGRWKDRRVLGGEALATSLLHADWLYWPSLTFRREALQRMPFRDGLPLIQDLAIVVDLVATGSSLLLEPELCFSYRRHTASASSARLLDGTRFFGERGYFREAATQMDALGWHKAARAARLHATSRAHALTLVPKAVAARDDEAVRKLLAHVTTT